MRRLTLVVLAFAYGLAGITQAAVPDKVKPEVASEKGCLSCHEGIESIRGAKSGMMTAIKALGGPQGDPEGCVVCHGGNPQGLTAEEAHSGVGPKAMPTGPKTFYPDPGSTG